jgi:hypothetical protein
VTNGGGSRRPRSRWWPSTTPPMRPPRSCSRYTPQPWYQRLSSYVHLSVCRCALFVQALQQQWQAEQEEDMKLQLAAVREELEAGFREKLVEQKEALREVVEAEVEEQHQLELTRLELQLGEASAASAAVSPATTAAASSPLPRKSMRLTAAADEQVRIKFVQPNVHVSAKAKAASHNPRKRPAYVLEE